LTTTLRALGRCDPGGVAKSEFAALVEWMLRTLGRRIDMSTPFVDAMLPDVSRLHVVILDMISASALTSPD
jgi:Flp pilus assembly CpaF family ATPase